MKGKLALKRKIIGATKLFVSVALIYYLLSIVNLDETIVRLRSMDIRFLGIALVLLVGQVAISAAKWQLILLSDGLSAPYLFLLKSNYIGISPGLACNRS